MKRKPAPKHLRTPAVWKRQIVEHLDRIGVGRFEFATRCAAKGVCARHTAECLLAADGTVTGQRVPSFAVAVEMARLAGLRVTMEPRPRTARRKKVAAVTGQETAK